MKFIIINGTLKPSSESNTSVICEMVKVGFEKFGHECEIVNMAELNYKNSTEDENDDLRPVIQRMVQPDMAGIIVATPIWWGMFSSHTQALIERLDYIDTWSLDDNHFKPMMGKVFGSIVSGGVDGWQHIQEPIQFLINHSTNPIVNRVRCTGQERNTERLGNDRYGQKFGKQHDSLGRGHAKR